MTTSNQNRQALQEYRRAIEQKLRNNPYQVGELTFRADFENLFKGFDNGSHRALHEPLGLPVGQPDFVIQKNEIPVGYVECKDIGIDLEKEAESEQLKRYRNGLNNLILTDYLTFRWYVDGDFQREARLATRRADGRIERTPKGYEDVELLLRDFLDQVVSVIDSPQELARRMATKTRMLRDSVRARLAENPETGSVADFQRLCKQLLVAGADNDAVADMYAQTAAYGLFAAWQKHRVGQDFTRRTAVFTQMTPFLGDALDSVAGRRTENQLVWVIDDLAQLLSRADREEVMKGFARTPGQDDPIIHFYQDFLAAYDRKMREMRGVYFTPLPVVSYIVRSIDYLLRHSFQIPDGLADTQKVEINKNEFHRVTILDPAVGTGTFLREVVANVHETIRNKGLGGIWQQYVKDDLLPRLHGFELLMAPYTISHLSLAIALGSIDIGDGEINIVLTNSLEPAHDTPAPTPGSGSMEAESARADNVKRDRPVMVVLGNPPYSGHSANKGRWISQQLDAFKQGVPELKKPGQAKWLSNDYVKFIRFAQRRIELTGEGILGFITDNSYLDGPTFRGMRRSLMETFDDIYILDLHGNSLKQEKAPDGGTDKNVFDIRQGVAIALFVKKGHSEKGLARVRHAERWGERADKYAWLEENDVGSMPWTELPAVAPEHFYFPRNEGRLSEYRDNTWPIPQIFSPNGDPAPGIVTTHDQFAISWDRDEAIAKVERLLATASEDEARSIWRLCSQDQWQYERAKNELRPGGWKAQVRPILYRPFDTRVTVYDPNVAVHRRERIMRHMLAEFNLSLGTVRNRQIDSDWQHVFVSSTLSTHHTVSVKEVNHFFPLYLYPTDEEQERGIEVRPNLDKGFVDAVGEATGLTFKPDGPGDLEATFGPQDVFHYIYGILHSPGYRTRYADFLKSDFPRIPLTQNQELFTQLIALGRRLTELHLMKAEPETQPTFPIEGTLRVDTPRFNELGQVAINRDQHFEGVSQSTWEFTIGGYRPAEKWLKDRKGRTLSADDVRHYMKMCGALAETQELMAEIDKVIGDAGGWPLK